MIKNYTSTVPVSRSVQHIEDRLVKHGAQKIVKEYDQDKKLAAICFTLMLNGREIPFKIPARVANVEKMLRGSVRRPTSGTYERIAEQAERSAWKLVSDWVDIQISLVELQQVEFMEVFLPYVYSPADRLTFLSAFGMEVSSY